MEWTLDDMVAQSYLVECDQDDCHCPPSHVLHKSEKALGASASDAECGHETVVADRFLSQRQVERRMKQAPLRELAKLMLISLRNRMSLD